MQLAAAPAWPSKHSRCGQHAGPAPSTGPARRGRRPTHSPAGAVVVLVAVRHGGNVPTCAPVGVEIPKHAAALRGGRGVGRAGEASSGGMHLPADRPPRGPPRAPGGWWRRRPRHRRILCRRTSPCRRRRAAAAASGAGPGLRAPAAALRGAGRREAGCWLGKAGAPRAIARFEELKPTCDQEPCQLALQAADHGSVLARFARRVRGAASSVLPARVAALERVLELLIARLWPQKAGIAASGGPRDARSSRAREERAAAREAAEACKIEMLVEFKQRPEARIRAREGGAGMQKSVWGMCLLL